MEKVQNAVILAAGVGSRFVPLTYEMPKGMIPVKGEGLVERQIKQLLEKGIQDIILVTGYRQEEYHRLALKYPGAVRCVYNPEYSSKNNISSLYIVRQELKSTYLLSSDNYYTKNIFHAEEAESWYCAVKDTKPRAEWAMDTDENGYISKVRKTASTGEPFMYGAVYFSTEFSERFRRILEKEYENPKNHLFVWEEILCRHLKELKIKIRQESADTILEIESVEELRNLDSKYQNYSGNRQLQLISKVFSVPESEITEITPQKMGLTNDSFLFRVRGKRYVFRLPGKGSEKFIHRQKEGYVYQTLKNMQITDQVVYFDAEGIKISVYEEGAEVLRFPVEKENVKKALQILKMVHQSEIKVSETFGLPMCDIFEKEAEGKWEFFSDYDELKEKLLFLENYLAERGVLKSFCHNDFVQENILCLPDGSIRFIDWEYSAMGNPMSDLGVLVVCSWQGEEELKELAMSYYERELTDLEWIQVYLGVAISAFTWGAWGKWKEQQGYFFTEENYVERIYSYVKPYIMKAMELIGEKI